MRMDYDTPFCFRRSQVNILWKSIKIESNKIQPQCNVQQWCDK